MHSIVQQNKPEWTDAMYFISHSSVDGHDLALRLRDSFLRAGTKAWMAPEDIPPAARWEGELDEALRDCKAVFFLITSDSVRGESGTRPELDRAKRYKKPIVPLRFDPDALIPYSLEGRQEIQFVGRFEGGLAALREHCRWLVSREGEIYQLKCRIQDGERELPREQNELRKQQIEKDLANLRESLAATRQALIDTGAAERNLRGKIDEGIKRERLEPEPVPYHRVIPVVNRRPASAPNNFQNRTAETQLMGQFLEDPSKRLLLVVGRGGVGKTAMVCRMLQEIENGRFPGGHVLRISFGAIVYMGAGPARNISFTNFYDDLCKLLPEGRRASLERLWVESQELTPRLVALTSAFSADSVIVLLDNFEDFIDSSTQNISDQELGEMLKNILALPDHSIKVIITSQVTPRALALYQPGRQMSLNLNEGLSSPYAEKLLQLMDSDGSVGLRDASPDVLGEIRRRTQGIPRALEAFYGILAADRYTSVSDILADASRILPDNVVQELVARAYHRLDEPAQRVFQALATYGEPVIAEAVDFLLEPFGPLQPSELILRRLVGMFLVRREGRHFFLHPVDAAFALTEIPEGTTENWLSGNAIFTRRYLFHRGAAYFQRIRRPEAGWRSIADLSPVLAQFKLLVGAGDWDGACDALDTMRPYLDRWGHVRQIERLAARLACEAGQPIKNWAAGLAGSAFSDLGEAPAAIEYLQLALEAPPHEISAAVLLNWRLTLGDCHFSLGHYPAAEAAYKQILKELELEDSTPKAMALLGLGSIAEVQSRPLEAEQQYRQALAVYAPQLSVAFVEEGDKTILAPSPLADALENPFSWHWLTDPVSIVDSDSDQAQGRLWLYGVEVPGKIADATPPDSSVGDAADKDIEMAFIQPTSELALIWMRFAELYAKTDRLREADAACRLAEKMYGDVQNDLGISGALDLMRRLAARLSDEDADQIARVQEERLQRARDAGDRSLEIAILKDLADYYLERRRYQDAEATYRELSRLATELENPSPLANAEFGLAKLDWIGEKSDDAIRRLEGLRESRAQDLRLQSDVDLLLARIEFSRNRRDTAARHCHKAAAGYAFLGSLSEQIEADRLMALIAIDARDYDQAVRRLEGTVELARAVGIPSLIISVLCDLAKAHLSAGQREASIARIEEATRNTSKIELPNTQAEALMTIGYIRSELKNFAPAEDAYQKARDVYERLGDQYGQFQTLSGLSRLYYLASESSKRLKVARAAWELLQGFGDRSEVRDARMDLSTALSENGFHAEAVEHMRAIVKEAPTAINIGNLGWILYEAGDYDRSLQESRRALEVDPSQVWVIRNLAHAYLALGKADDAEREYKRAIQTRKGGEDFFETIRIVRKLASGRLDLPRVHEMLHMLEEEQQAIEAKAAAALGQS